MGIYATAGQTIDPVPAGNHVARCFRMVHIGTIAENFNGDTKILNKVWISWELPFELYDDKPRTISAEYTLSMNEKANLRKMLASWRGKDFTKEEAEKFEVSKLVGIPCFLNVIHKTAGNGNTYANVASVAPIAKGMTAPEPFNAPVALSYDNFSTATFESLPDYIKDKMKKSTEYEAMNSAHDQTVGTEEHNADVAEIFEEPLPF